METIPPGPVRMLAKAQKNTHSLGQSAENLGGRKWIFDELSSRAHTHAAMMRRPDKDFHSSADELSAAKFQRHRKWILTRVARRRERQKEKRKSYGSFTQVEKKKKKLWIINCRVSTHFANSWDNENAYIQVSSLARGEIFSSFQAHMTN